MVEDNETEEYDAEGEVEADNKVVLESDYDDYDHERDYELLCEKVRQVIGEISEDAEVDEARGEVIIRAATPAGIEITERVRSLDDLRDLLDDIIMIVMPSDWAEQIDSWQIDEVLEDFGAVELFQDIKSPGMVVFRATPDIICPSVKIEIATVNEALIRYLSDHPQMIYNLRPRQFEELVAELFRDFGYEVVLTPRSRDGGVDVRAIHKDSIGTLLYLIECKRHKPDNPVGVDVVRALYGVAAAEQATYGILAATSYFTKDAQEFAKTVQYRLSLRDYDDLIMWLKQYGQLRRRQ